MKTDIILKSLTGIPNSKQIKSKYRELTLKNHPDKNKSVDSNTKMAEINNAYEIIMKAITHSTVS